MKPILMLMLVLVTACARQDAAQGDPGDDAAIRFATYNVYLNRAAAGALRDDLKNRDNAQAQKVAEIIQRAAPDVLLLNEFDYDEAGEALRLFQQNYLEVSQNGAPAAVYPYVFSAPSNTGLPSGHDLDRDGKVTTTPGDRGYGGDAFGFGVFPGQYGMAILSKYPIDQAAVRTFQRFLWKDMPDALFPDDPETAAPQDWYAPAALADFRLSSKSHWDVPVNINGDTVHVLASHPTPPSFDGDEDRNGKRNHDENRLWADYINGEKGGYIYDDEGGRGGLAPNARFVIMGDLNADPHDGGSVPGAIRQLLESPKIEAAAAPSSAGGANAAARQAGANEHHKGPPEEDTADFNDDADAGVGNLRLDYVIPSAYGLQTRRAGVFWPAEGEPHYELIGPGFPVESSDHRLVWRDLVIMDD